jgi:hypothetical protein
MTGNVPPILYRIPRIAHDLIFTLCIYKEAVRKRA